VASNKWVKAQKPSDARGGSPKKKNVSRLGQHGGPKGGSLTKDQGSQKAHVPKKKRLTQRKAATKKDQTAPKGTKRPFTMKNEKINETGNGRPPGGSRTTLGRLLVTAPVK